MQVNVLNVVSLLAACFVTLSTRAAWAEPTKLLPSDGATTLGSAVSVSGTTALVGASSDSTSGVSAGAAYVFVLSSGSWTEQQKLIASDGASGDQFGWSVAVDGDIAVVGAPRRDDLGPSAGSAYVFVRSGTVWSQEAKLLPADGAANREFGWSVALNASTALVGAVADAALGEASGSAYAFVRSNGTWSQQQKFLALAGDAGDLFGISVSISGDTALIGAPGVSDNGANSGGAYAFVRSGVNWSQEQKIEPFDPAAGDRFGQSISVWDNYAAIGTPFDGDNASQSGSAYVFARSGGNWLQQQKLTAADGAVGDNFGISVSLNGNTMLIGAHLDDDLGTNSGSAYVFTRLGTAWVLAQKLRAAPLVSLFGSSVSVGATQLLVGAPGEGSAYAAPLPTASVPATDMHWTIVVAVSLLGVGLMRVPKRLAQV